MTVQLMLVSGLPWNYYISLLITNTIDPIGVANRSVVQPSPLIPAVDEIRKTDPICLVSVGEKG